MILPKSFGRQIRLLGLVLFASLLLPDAPRAQELSQDWEILGTFSVRLNDDMMSLYAVRNTGTGDATLKRMPHGEAHIIQVTGVTPTAVGQPGVPILTITLGPFWGEVPDGIAVDLREADRHLMATIESETEASLIEATLTDTGQLTFSFEAELAVMSPTADGSFEPASGAVPARISGDFEGQIPLQ